MPDTFKRIDSYIAGAYWGARKETPEECALRAEKFLKAMINIDPAFARWFQQGKSRKDALKRLIEPSRPALENLIRRGKDRFFDEIGYSVWAWNGALDDYDASGFNFCCGGYGEVRSNRCVLNLPTRGPNAERVLSAPVLAEVIRSMALAWEPETAIATSTMHRDTISSTGIAGTYMSWVMYFPREQGTVPPLPAPVRTEPVEDKGTLVILTPEKLTADNPEHIELAQRVHPLMEKAGLLRTVSP
ncbi:immunity 52 family protein [Melittangium boletus]|uniref:immunity 52 family protein n=1 Tax=Melittangium boletus TaxID=83453 RepID=UPI003DA4B5FF